MADGRDQSSAAGATVLAPNVVASVNPPVAEQPTDFSSGKFTIDDLKTLDIETIGLVELNDLTLNLIRVLNQSRDGILDNQDVFAVPVEGAQAANLKTNGLWTNRAPKDHRTLVFSVEVAYWAAQIVHELGFNRRLFDFNEKLKGAYVLEPKLLLKDWTETNEENFSVKLFETKDHWQHVIDALLDAVSALKTAIQQETPEAVAEKKVEVTAETTATTATAEDEDDFFGSTADESDVEGGGDSAAAEAIVVAPGTAGSARRRDPLTAPQDLMRNFLRSTEDGGTASNKQYLRALQGIGFNAHERRLIIDQTAWIYNGILAQLFPNAIGNFESLDPVARAQINQIVRDYMMALPGGMNALQALIANPVGRREIILDILRGHAAVLSVLTKRDQQRLESDITHLSREAMITEQLPDLEKYLVVQATAEGRVLPVDEARIQAYNALSILSAGELRNLSAGIISTRVNVYERAAKSTAATTLTGSLAGVAGAQLESLDVKNITHSLDGFILSKMNQGLTEQVLLDYLTSLPGSELLALISVFPSHPLYPTYLANIESVRSAVLAFVQQRALALCFSPTVVVEEVTAPRVDTTPRSFATSPAGAALVGALATSAGSSVADFDLSSLERSLDQAVVSFVSQGQSPAAITEYFETAPVAELLVLLGVDVAHPLYSTYLGNSQTVRGAVLAYVRQRVASPQVSRVEPSPAQPTPPLRRAAGGVIPLPTITAKSIEESGLGTPKIADRLQPSTTSKTKAFFKHYLERWNNLTVDEQAVVYLLTDKRVPEIYLQQNPPVELLEPAMGYIEMEAETHGAIFQELVSEFSKNRGKFKHRTRVLALQAAYASGRSADVRSTTEQLPDSVQKAAAFEEKYDASWRELSRSQQTAIYLLAGLTVPAVAALQLPVAYVDLVDLVGTPAFNELVALVEQNPNIATDSPQMAPFQNIVAEAGVDTSTSQDLLEKRDAQIAEIEYMLGSMEPENQQTMVADAGYSDLESLVADYNENSGLLGDAAGLSPEEIAFRGPPGTVADLDRFRQAKATNAPLPQVVDKAKRLGKEALKKGWAVVDKSIGRALMAVPVAGAALSALWGNKYTKWLLGIPLISYLRALTSWTGVAGSAIGTGVGMVTPVGPLLGNFLGAHIGYYGPWGSGSWLPWRLPPSPFAEPAVQSVFPSASVAGQEAAAAAVSPLVVTPPAAGAAASVAAAASSLLATFAWPLYAVGTIVALSLTVMLVIWGAFIAPSPTAPLPSGAAGGDTQISAKYITITKTAEPNQFDNPSAGQTYDVAYTVTIAPKPGYKIKVTGMSDEYSSFGKTPVGALTSPISFDEVEREIEEQYPNGLLTGEFAIGYTQTGITGEDAYLINRATIQFDVYDYLGTPADKSPDEWKVLEGLANQNYVASAIVVIGEPTVGCFELGAGGLDLGDDGGKIITKDFSTEEIAVFAQAFSHPVMTNPTYIQLLCGPGPVTIYRAVGSGRTWWGWGGVPRAMVFYDLTDRPDAFSSPTNLFYNFLHESAHLIDASGGRMYRREFSALLPAGLYDCFTYPLKNRCRNPDYGPSEAFAEALMLYVLNRTPGQTPNQYDFKATYPEPYDWLKENIFGGIEYN